MGKVCFLAMAPAIFDPFFMVKLTNALNKQLHKCLSLDNKTLVFSNRHYLLSILSASILL